MARKIAIMIVLGLLGLEGRANWDGSLGRTHARGARSSTFAPSSPNGRSRRRSRWSVSAVPHVGDRGRTPGRRLPTPRREADASGLTPRSNRTASGAIPPRDSLLQEEPGWPPERSCGRSGPLTTCR